MTVWAPLGEDDQADVLSAVRTWWGDDGGGQARVALLPRLFFQHFGTTSWTVRRDGRLLAFLVGFLSQSRSDTAHVHFLAVDPDERGIGLGRQLHQRFAERARLDGRTVVEAITSVGNTHSQDFHRHLGFTVGEPITDYDGAGASRVVFRRDI